MNLDKALRAMQHCEAWQARVQGACLLAGKEYGQPVLSTMTNQFLDDLDYDAETLIVTVPSGIDGALLKAVEAYEPPAESSHVQDLTDAQIVEQINALRVEQDRRATLLQALQGEPALMAAYQESLGRVDGAQWQKPTGYHNAYMKGQVVTWEGQEWEARRDGAIEMPGMSDDWRLIQPPGVIPEWVQPSGYLGAYDPGAIVQHNGHVWRNDHNAGNAWEPGTTGAQWADLGPIEDYNN